MIHMLLRSSQHAKREFMPRPASTNTFQVAFKIPRQWVKDADAVAKRLRESVVVSDDAQHALSGLSVTRTDVLRAALWAGLQEMTKRKVKK